MTARVHTTFELIKELLLKETDNIERTNEAVSTPDDIIDDEYSTNTSDNQPPSEVLPPPEPPQPDERWSRYGRLIRPPARYQND